MHILTGLLLGLAALAVEIDEGQARRLADFAARPSIAVLKSGDHVQLGWAREPAPYGGCARIASVDKGAVASFELGPSLLGGWAGYDFLAFDCWAEGDRPVRLTVEFRDQAATDFHSRATYEGGRSPPPVQPGRPQTILIDLRRAWRNRYQGRALGELSQAEKIDFAKLTAVRFWLTPDAGQPPPVIRLDNLRLLPASALGSPLDLRLPAGSLALDFGAGESDVGGAEGVSPAVAWKPGARFGFVGDIERTAVISTFPDPLVGDYVRTKLAQDEALAFRFTPPPGRFLLWIVCFCEPLEPGAPVTSVTVSRGEQTWDLAGDGRQTGDLARFHDLPVPSDDASLWWNALDTSAYRPFQLTLEPGDGPVTVSVRRAALSAVVAIPLDGQDEAAAELVESRLQQPRRAYFEKTRAGDFQPCTNGAQTGQIVIADRQLDSPWSLTPAESSAPPALAASPGETVWLRVIEYPAAGQRAETVRSTGTWSVSVSIPAPEAAMDAPVNIGPPFPGALTYHGWALTYHGIGRQVVPFALIPADDCHRMPGLAATSYIELTIPANAPYGRYELLLDICPQPVRLLVTPPLELAPCDLAVGLFYKPPWFRKVLYIPARQSTRAETMPAQMALMAKFGLSSVEVLPPDFRRGENGEVTFDPADSERMIAAARAAGLGATPAQPLPIHMLLVQRMASSVIEGYHVPPDEEWKLPGFETLLAGWYDQLAAWQRAGGYPLAWWMVDEPREHPNPWNRDFASTVRHCRLARQHGLSPLLLTLIRDHASDVDYTRLVDEADIIAFHGTEEAAGIGRRTQADPKRRLWLFNAGRDRLSFGWYPWRIGAAGRFQWHFGTVPDEWTQTDYHGHDLFNPYTAIAEVGATVPAPDGVPSHAYPTPLLVTIYEGIMDYRYVGTLERELARARSEGRQPEAVAQAEAFLASCRAAIPELLDAPGVDRAALDSQLPAWRLRLAGYLAALAKQR